MEEARIRLSFFVNEEMTTKTFDCMERYLLLIGIFEVRQNRENEL